MIDWIFASQLRLVLSGLLIAMMLIGLVVLIDHLAFPPSLQTDIDCARWERNWLLECAQRRPLIDCSADYRELRHPGCL